MGNPMDANKIEDAVRKLHVRAKDGSVKVDGETFTLKFDQAASHYKVFDQSGSLVCQLNTRKLSDAKRMWIGE